MSKSGMYGHPCSKMYTLCPRLRPRKPYRPTRLFFFEAVETKGMLVDQLLHLLLGTCTNQHGNYKKRERRTYSLRYPSPSAEFGYKAETRRS